MSTFRPYSYYPYYGNPNSLFSIFDTPFFGNPVNSIWLDFQPSYRSQQDIRQVNNSYEITLEIPGATSNDVSVTCEDDVLSISGSFRGNGGRYAESFSYSYSLDEGTATDDIKANIENGILTVTVPKVDPEQSIAHTINVTEKHSLVKPTESELVSAAGKVHGVVKPKSHQLVKGKGKVRKVVKPSSSQLVQKARNMRANSKSSKTRYNKSTTPRRSARIRNQQASKLEITR